MCFVWCGIIVFACQWFWNYRLLSRNKIQLNNEHLTLHIFHISFFISLVNKERFKFSCAVHLCGFVLIILHRWAWFFVWLLWSLLSLMVVTLRLFLSKYWEYSSFLEVWLHDWFFWAPALYFDLVLKDWKQGFSCFLLYPCFTTKSNQITSIFHSQNIKLELLKNSVKFCACSGAKF